MSRINPKARAADLTHERLSREIKTIALRAGVDSRVVEVDGEVQWNPLCGTARPILSPSSPRTVSLDVEFLLPSSALRCRHPAARTRTDCAPSMIGISAASTSMTMLSMPNPARAALRCSTVEIRNVMLCHRVSTEHGITHGFCISRKINRWIQVKVTIDDPVLAGAGRIVSVTSFLPVCKPTPVA